MSRLKQSLQVGGPLGTICALQNLDLFLCSVDHGEFVRLNGLGKLAVVKSAIKHLLALLVHKF